MKQKSILLISIILMRAWASAQSVVPLWKTVPDIPPMIRADDSGYAAVNDIKMYYAVFNNDGKDPVLLLHGGFSNSDCWSFEVPLLAKTHKVIVCDSRGQGRSNMSDQPFSYNLMASDVLGLMDHLKLGKTSIVGWSDGGIIGLILAIQHPERINKLFTYGANYSHSGEKSEKPDSAMSARFMAKVVADYHKLSPAPDGFAKLRSALGKLYTDEPEIDPEEIKSITAPTVIAYGQYEQFYKAEHFQDLANLIPGAKLIMLTNVSHGGPWQDPAQFHKAVASLLDRN